MTRMLDRWTNDRTSAAHEDDHGIAVGGTGHGHSRRDGCCASAPHRKGSGDAIPTEIALVAPLFDRLRTSCSEMASLLRWGHWGTACYRQGVMECGEEIMAVLLELGFGKGEHDAISER